MSNEPVSIFVIDDQVKASIEQWRLKYPKNQTRSLVIPALLLAQEQNGGWLSRAALDAVAAYLDLPHIVVYEVATFYDLYHLKPVGRHKINICTNVSCFLRGSDALVACMKKHFGVGLGETSQDGFLTLQGVECLGACAGAPMCQIDDKAYHEHLNSEKLLAIINQLKKDRPHINAVE